MDYEILKSLHIIGIVCWFAGLFYIVRLFIYHREALDKTPAEQNVLIPQFILMEKRLWYGITHPAMFITLLFGFLLMMKVKTWMMPWFHVKALFLLLLFAYHIYCGKIRKQLVAKTFTKTSSFLRIYNEMATLFLISIVFLAMTKEPTGALWGPAIFLLMGTLFFSVKKMIQLKKNTMKEKKAAL